MHASQIQGCVVEQRVEKKRQIAESVWVHNAVTVRTGKLVPLSSANSPRTLGMLLHLQLSPIWEQEALAVQQGDIISKIQISEGALAKRHK